MRHIIFILILITSCSYKEDSIGFLIDENDYKLSSKTEHVVNDFEFYVVYSSGNEGEEAKQNSTKIFGMKKESEKKFWYKIDFVESEYTTIGTEVVFVDYLIQKSISDIEAETFMNELKKHDLFGLKRGKTISAECTKALNLKLGERSHRDYSFIRVVSDSITKSRKYFDVKQMREKCPTKKDWQNILAIDSLFLNDWTKIPTDRNFGSQYKN